MTAPPSAPIPVPAALDARSDPPLVDSTIGDQLRMQAERVPDRPALIWAAAEGVGDLHTLTHRDLRVAVDAAAVDLASRAQPGDRVAVWAANSPEWVILECASALCGTVLAPFNTAWTDDEVDHALALTTPVVVYTGSDGRGTDLRRRADDRAKAATRACTVVDLATVALRPAPEEFDPPPVEPDDPFLIQFTSGTTGRAKGATLSHRAALNAGLIRAATLGADEQDVWLNPVPLHHVGGSVIIVLAALGSGGAYVVMPRFDPRAQLALIRSTGATRTGGVPTMFFALLEEPDGEQVLKGVRSIGLGGTNVPPSLIEQLQSYGAVVSVAFAQSECPMITQSNPAGDANHVATTVGIPVPHTEIRIVDVEGRVVNRGETGEICVRSPLTMTGYWGMPDATAASFDRDGFLHTGDLASIDRDGVTRILGRAREVIIRGGENIYPAEIEDVLLRHPAVVAVAVVATPSTRWGEEVAAVVQLGTPGAATTDELTEHAARSLAHFKVPRHWRFVDSFPVTASGKIRKVELPAIFDEAPS